ncbi:MAG: tripartite tricarboxylate transporter permease [Synergistaceae bacterium]|nr:tripartite tricarboxylate transporter permease [Synergistaceae bacterium]MBQ3397424.1 tripartite tricarboxylate transporter permease [Synergistaceae bacterium]MBQ6114127.1 tripartite tricarboxylate transporter permease [Synergistaceae bacterium]MBQ6665949.1 tripartite tricarboxylate transporter permease [Synergistaceae bacterium]MBQ6982072.1 tripartite tricarboxylate transporter permease [Synergistaceae bacterium]
MSTWELFTNGFSVLMDPYTFLMVVFAIVVGTIFGALPGVSATMAVALGLPFTYSMQPIPAIVFLVAVYCSSITGGSITAILFKIPGVPSSAPTTFDGYPMAQRGEAGKALGIALGSSAIGGLVSALAMLTLSPQLTQAALSFSPSDIFAVTFMGLSILTCLDSKNILRTLISGLLGLLLACVGQDPMYAVQRLTFGSGELIAGLEMIPVLIGIFAVTEVLKQTKKRETLKSDEGNASVNTKMPSFREWWGIKWLLARCSVIGTIIGILPGAGATIASFLCYSTETKLSKHPEKFGTGIIDGVAASETANNAATGGAMVPLLSLGIPGGNAAAVMMSALVLKGVQLGPLLLVNQPQYLSATFASMVVTNILMVVVAIGIAKVFAQILAVPYSYLGPIIIMLAIIGSYATNMSIADVKIMAIAGVLGLVISACHFNSAALILGLVLGVICEGNFSRAYTISRASIVNMFARPVAGTLMVVSIVLLVWPILSSFFKKKEA